MVDEFYGRITARSSEVQAKYDASRAALRLQYGSEGPCPFCNDATRNLVAEHEGLYVLRNNFPYEVYDGRGVKEHLMIVPKKHSPQFSDFSDQVIKEYWRVLSEYHASGYSSMTRSATDSGRSVPGHLHTHLFLYFTDSK